jgi:hypothetical protein
MRPVPRNHPAPPCRLPVLVACMVRGALLATRYLPAATTRNQAQRLVTQTAPRGPGIDDTAHLLAALEKRYKCTFDDARPSCIYKPSRVKAEAMLWVCAGGIRPQSLSTRNMGHPLTGVCNLCVLYPASLGL